MLGDNPMQSKFACHIGFRGKYFCRVCWVKGVPDEEEEGEDDISDISSASESGTDATQHQKKGKKKKKKTVKKKDESVADMISRVTQFMSVRPERFTNIYFY